MYLNKKKIRGWKRRKRNIVRWKNSHIDLDKDTLRDFSRDYVKLWIHPFFSLNHYELPYWYKKLLIDSLIDIYFSWKKDLEVEQEYYLKIWIFEKDFMHSQVVIATGDFFHFYDNTFADIEIIQDLPQTIRTEKTEKFNWHKGYVVSTLRETELSELYQEGIYSKKEMDKLKNSAYLITEEKNDRVYYLRDDKVWIN